MALARITEGKPKGNRNRLPELLSQYAWLWFVSKLLMYFHHWLQRPFLKHRWNQNFPVINIFHWVPTFSKIKLVVCLIIYWSPQFHFVLSMQPIYWHCLQMTLRIIHSNVHEISGLAALFTVFSQAHYSPYHHIILLANFYSSSLIKYLYSSIIPISTIIYKWIFISIPETVSMADYIIEVSNHVLGYHVH